MTFFVLDDFLAIGPPGAKAYRLECQSITPMDTPKGKLTAAELARNYIDRHPSIRDLISKGLVNYSSLARLIMKDLGIKNEKAVLAACRRYAMKLPKSDTEGAVIRVFEQSRLELKTRICIVVAKNEWAVLRSIDKVARQVLAEKGTMLVLQSTNAISVISEDKHMLDLIKAIGRDSIIMIKENLAQITVRSPPAIEDIAGAFSYLMTMLSEQGISLSEIVSCYADTILIVRRKDVMAAFEILSKVIEGKVIPEVEV